MKKVEFCAVCGNPEFAQVFPGEIIDRHTEIKGDFSLSKCNKCGLIFMNPMPEEVDFNHFYAKNYYSYGDHFTPKKENTIKKYLAFVYRKIIEIKTFDPPMKPGKILDIGCGSGKILFSYKKLGWETNGVEVSREAAELGNKKAELNIFAGELLESNYQNNYFDYIRSNHSFEHIHNPNETLQEVFRILAPGGNLFIGVPNTDSWPFKIFGAYWYHLGAPVHTYGYSASTLCSILRKQGFEIKYVRYNGNFYGFLGSFQMYLLRNNVQPVDNGKLIHNRVLQMISKFCAVIANAFRAGDCIEVVACKPSQSK